MELGSLMRLLIVADERYVSPQQHKIFLVLDEHLRARSSGSGSSPQLVKFLPGSTVTGKIGSFFSRWLWFFLQKVAF